MKHTLLIMRHSKSSWDNSSLEDKIRPLNLRGQNDAPMMGKRIAGLGYQFDCIISSPATRAMMTAQSVADAICFGDNIILDETLYLGGLENIEAVLKNLDENISSIMLFGHNPDCHEFYEKYTQKSIKKFPTASFAIFELSSSWKELENVRELWFDKPKS